MYQSGNPSCCYYGGEVDNSDPSILANGEAAAAFLPPSSYAPLHYSESQQGLVGPPRPSGQMLLPLSSPTSSGMASFRRVLSTGDLSREEEHRVVPLPAGRYSAEERRERIDKYRSKRNHRNFQKKITYACRKTLADSRPRVKGRFARNSDGGDYTEAEQAADVLFHPPCGMPPVNDIAAVDLVKEDSDTTTQWWPATQEAMDDDDLLDNLCDEEMLAAYLGVSSISLYSLSCDDIPQS